MPSRSLLVFVTSLLCAGGTIFSLPATAETPLTQAIIQRLRNEVKLHPKQQRSRTAQTADVMTPGDALSTSRQAMAELRFNDRSLARVGEKTVFEFEPNTRSFDLRRGTVLLLIQPGQGRTRVRTPNATAGIRGSAMFIRSIEDSQVSLFGALTDTDIEISTKDGKTVTLKAGQMAYVHKNQIGVYNFDQRLFQKTGSLFKDIDWNEAPIEVKAEIEAALEGKEAIIGKYEDSPAWTKLAENRSTPVIAATASGQQPVMMDRPNEGWYPDPTGRSPASNQPPNNQPPELIMAQPSTPSTPGSTNSNDVRPEPPRPEPPRPEPPRPEPPRPEPSVQAPVPSQRETPSQTAPVQAPSLPVQANPPTQITQPPASAPQPITQPSIPTIPTPPAAATPQPQTPPASQIPSANNPPTRPVASPQTTPTPPTINPPIGSRPSPVITPPVATPAIPATPPSAITPPTVPTTPAVPATPVVPTPTPTLVNTAPVAASTPPPAIVTPPATVTPPSVATPPVTPPVTPTAPATPPATAPMDMPAVQAITTTAPVVTTTPATTPPVTTTPAVVTPANTAPAVNTVPATTVPSRTVAP